MDRIVVDLIKLGLCLSYTERWKYDESKYKEEERKDGKDEQKEKS